HLTNLSELARAAKRGGGRAALDVQDLEALLASSDRPPEELFEKAWALVVFEESLDALEAEFASGARQGPFDVLRDLFAFGTTLPAPDLAAKHGMSLSQLKSFVHRSKHRFRDLVRDRVAATLGDEEDVDREIQQLMEAMGR